MIDAELRLPAENAYVSVLRMTTAGLAARMDFTLDDIEDLRMAVGEACSLVLDGARPQGQLHVAYELGDGQITVNVSVDTDLDDPPDRESFAWQVLHALADDLQTQNDAGRRGITFTVTSAKV